MKLSGQERIAAARSQWARRAVDSVTLDLPFPVSTNALWTRSKRGIRRTARYESWSTVAGQELNRQRPGMVKGQFIYTALIQRKKDRKRDLDNLTKGILDLLQEHGIIDNDSLCERITVAWSDEITGCRVCVERDLSTFAKTGA